MAITTRENVIAIAPELAAIAADDPRWVLFIADAETEVGIDAVGGPAQADRLARNLVAHLMTRSKLNGQSGAGDLKSITVGPVSKVFRDASPGGSGSALASTSYGQEFLRLIELFGPHFTVSD